MSDYGGYNDGRALTDEDQLAAQRAEERKRAASSLIHAFFRLVKACMLHSESNQAVQSLLPVAVSAVGDFCQAAQSEAATLLFAGETVFMGGQILRASRETYAVAQELGAYLDTAGVTELTFERTITSTHIGVFARRLAEAQRDRNVAAGLIDAHLPSIRLRRVMGLAGDGPLEQDDSPVARVGRVYAAAILIVRSLYVDLRRGEMRLPQRVKRVAQKLVALSEEDPRLLVALATSTAAEGDFAAIAVNSAILCMMLVRQLTSDRMTLATITMTALLFDSARLRLTTSTETSVTRVLNDAEQDALPASAVVALTALGRLHGPSLPRAVVAYEAYYLQRAARLGPVYRGMRQPSVLGRILAMARTFCELRVPVKGGVPLRLDDVIQLLSNRATDATERTYVKLLIGALGFFPTGTLVELNTGEMGVVMAAPEKPADFARPPIRVLYDEGANLLDEPFDLDLAAPVAKGVTRRVIRRPIDAGDQQMKAMRAFAMAAVAPKAAPAPAPARPAAKPATAHDSSSRHAVPREETRAPKRPVREPMPLDPEPILPLESMALVQGPPLHDPDETTLTGPLEAPDEPPDEGLEQARRSYLATGGSEAPPPRVVPEVRVARPAAEPPAPARSVEPRETRGSDPGARPARAPRPLIPRGDSPPPPAPPVPARPVTPAPLRTPSAAGSYAVSQPRRERPSAPEPARPPPAAPPARAPAPAPKPAPRLTDTDKLLAAYLSEGAVDIASKSSIQRPPPEPARPEPARPASPARRQEATQPSPTAARAAASPQPPAALPAASPQPPAVRVVAPPQPPAPRAAKPVVPREEPQAPAATRAEPPRQRAPQTPAYGMAPVVPPRAPAKANPPLPREDIAHPSVAPTRMIQWSRAGDAIPPPPASSDPGPAPISVPPPSGIPTRHFDWSQEALPGDAAPETPRGRAPESEPLPPSKNPTRAFQWSRDVAPATAPPPTTAPHPGLSRDEPMSEPPPSFHPTRAVKWASTEAFLAGLETTAARDDDE